MTAVLCSYTTSQNCNEAVMSCCLLPLSIFMKHKPNVFLLSPREFTISSIKI